MVLLQGHLNIKSVEMLKMIRIIYKVKCFVESAVFLLIDYWLDNEKIIWQTFLFENKLLIDEIIESYHKWYEISAPIKPGSRFICGLM